MRSLCPSHVSHLTYCVTICGASNLFIMLRFGLTAATCFPFSPSQVALTFLK